MIYSALADKVVLFFRISPRLPNMKPDGGRIATI
jgi:hypothetical protein